MIERLRTGEFTQPEPNPWKNTSRADVHKVVLQHNVGHEPQQPQNGIHGEDEDGGESDNENENDNDNDDDGGGEEGEVQVPGYLESLMSICAIM